MPEIAICLARCKASGIQFFVFQHFVIYRAPTTCYFQTGIMATHKLPEHQKVYCKP